ncbi:rhodanese-like domain-containing protein, partial [Methylopila musalis]
CASGVRARKAAERLVAAGFTQVEVVEGGLAAWRTAGLPVTEGQGGVISLERQVRIAAGSLVVLGVLIAATLTSWGLLLAGFVGAGLVFAGVTDTCGLGLLLARATWNRAPR